MRRPRSWRSAAAMQADIDAIDVASVTNIATAQTAFNQVKAALTSMNNKLTNMDKNLMRCLFAKGHIGQ